MSFSDPSQSVVCGLHFQTTYRNHISPVPISTKFHPKPPQIQGKEVYSDGAGPLTKMASIVIYGKWTQENMLLFKRESRFNFLIHLYETRLIRSI